MSIYGRERLKQPSILAIATSAVQLFLGEAQGRGMAISRVEHTAEEADLPAVGVDLSTANDDIALSVIVLESTLTRINRPQTMLTEEESAGMEIRVAKMRRPQLKTSTWISGASPSNLSSVNLRDLSKKASLRGCTQSRSMLKYWTYRRWEGVVKSSTFPPRRSQQR